MSTTLQTITSPDFVAEVDGKISENLVIEK